MSLKIAGFVAATLLTGSSQAAIVTLDLSGHVSFVNSTLVSTFTTGQTWTAQIAYDDSTPPDSGSDLHSAGYSGAVTSLTLRFPGATFSSGGSSRVVVYDNHFYSPNDLADYWYLSVDPLDGPALGLGAPRFGLVFEERNAAPTFFSSPSLSAPELHYFEYAFLQYPGFKNVQLLLDSLAVHVVVPEPSTLALAALGMLGIGAVRRSPLKPPRRTRATTLNEEDS